MTPPPPTDPSPQASLRHETHASSIKLTGELVRWTRNLSGAHGTHTKVSPAAGGDMIVMPKGQGPTHIEVVRTT
jgi:hypothetical protein